MGGKVNLYLDDECLHVWHTIPLGMRSQIVRQALLNQYANDASGREKLLMKQKERELTMVGQRIDELTQQKTVLISEIEELRELAN